MQYGIEESGSGTPSEVISTADLKAFLRVTHSDEDTLIEAMREAAIRHIESYCNIRIGDRTGTFYFNHFPDRVELPVGPITAVSSVEYATADGTFSTMNAGDYFITYGRDPLMIEFNTIPSYFTDTFRKMKVTATLGYAEADVPGPVVHAIKLLVSHMYDIRSIEVMGVINKVKLGLEALLNPYRIISFR